MYGRKGTQCLLNDEPSVTHPVLPSERQRVLFIKKYNTLCTGGLAKAGERFERSAESYESWKNHLTYKLIFQFEIHKGSPHSQQLQVGTHIMTLDPTINTHPSLCYITYPIGGQGRTKPCDRHTAPPCQPCCAHK